MFSNIQSLIIDPQTIRLVKNHTKYLVSLDITELFNIKKVTGSISINNENAKEVTVYYTADNIRISDKDGEIVNLFCPHEMIRCIRKDFNKNRDFDLEYRKHLVNDYSREHYNIIVPYEVSLETKEKAEELIKRHSTGKQNRPTGIVLNHKVIVVKGDSHYIYDI